MSKPCATSQSFPGGVFVSLATLGCPAHALLALACDVLCVDQRPTELVALAAATLRTCGEPNTEE